MFKKLFSLMATLVLCCSVTSAEAFDPSSLSATPVNLSVVLDTPAGYAAEPERVYANINESLNKIFPNKSIYKIQPIEDNEAYVQVYREENCQAASVDDGYTTGNGMRDLTLKKSDLATLNDHFGSDYLVYIRITNSAPQVKVDWFSAGQQVNVTMDFRIWSKAKNDFVYMKRTMTTGKSTSYYAGMGDSGHAIAKGIKKGLAEVEKEASKIRMAMTE